ncbi:MAG: ABC transporter substrate-binding protein, partial [Euryarchaeota archaeon]|nr:ABC transporter substrate-binding protein [Euryarchaeota archaeon]
MKTSVLAGIAMTMLLLVLPAAASDYTLGVFGNANEDDTINMQDVTYTELIILEYRDKTELSDAKYDGKINMQDVTQIELVILGKEKELTVLDSIENTVTVKKPVERIIVSKPAVVE